MPIKHQASCYRIIKGIKYENYCDLIQGEAEKTKAIEEARSQFKHVKKIKHWSGEYYQLFVAN